jgi:hypothetical protein
MKTSHDFKEGFLMVTLRDGSKKRIRGHLHRDGLLAIHRYEKPFLRHQIYQITHIPTGLGITDLETLKQAKAVVRGIADLDWNFTDPQHPSVSAQERLGQKVKSIRHQVMQEA